MVFDKYPVDGAKKNTKTSKCIWHYSFLQCNKVIFEESTMVKMAQEKLLANDD